MTENATLGADDLWRLVLAARERAPIIHNIANDVMLADTASIIAAVGGTQATVHNIEEARDLAAIAGAVVINIGTPDANWMTCARIAAETAMEKGTPWILDPVAYGLLPYRSEGTRALLAFRPSVIKGNATELMALAGANVVPHGADSRHSTAEAESSMCSLAVRHGATVAVTGSTDLVGDGTRTARVMNGHPLMPRMIGTGCLATAVIGVLLAVARTPFDAAVAGLAVMGIAGEIAGERAQGPGSMKTHFLDALYNLDRDTFCRRLRCTYG